MTFFRKVSKIQKKTPSEIGKQWKQETGLENRKTGLRVLSELVLLVTVEKLGFKKSKDGGV